MLGSKKCSALRGALGARGTRGDQGGGREHGVWPTGQTNLEGFHLLKNIIFPLLVLRGIYHRRKYFVFVQASSDIFSLPAETLPWEPRAGPRLVAGDKIVGSLGPSWS